MFVKETPGYIETYLEEDTGADIGGSGMDTGADVGESFDGTDSGDSQVANEGYYFDYDFGPDRDTGEERKGAYKTKEELLRDFQGHYMRRSDYTKKTQSLAEQRKAFEKEQERYKDEQAYFAKKMAEIQEMEAKIKKLPPQVYQQLVGQVQSEMSKDPVIRQLQERLEAEDKEKEERKKQEEAAQESVRFQKDVESASNYLKKVYPDFNQEDVIQLVMQMRQGPPEEQLVSLLEAVYHKHKSTSQPKPKAPSPYGGGGKPANPQKPVDGSWDDLAENYKKRLGVK